jgi:hypothetical protein
MAFKTDNSFLGSDGSSTGAAPSPLQVATQACDLDGNGDGAMWDESAFPGLASKPFPKEAIEVLNQRISHVDIEIKPGKDIKIVYSLLHF